MSLKSSTTTTKTSPPLSIKRLGRDKNGQWQEFIDREHSSVDQLIKDSFASYVAKHGAPTTEEARSKMFTGSLQRHSPSKSTSATSTMPRRSPGKQTSTRELFIDETDNSSAHFEHLIRPRRPVGTQSSSPSPPKELPPGIEELETLYAPMRNLLEPLPNARKYSGNAMPALHPLGLPPLRAGTSPLR